MPFWSGETLKVRLRQLITDYRDERVDCNAYTLRMGNEYFCTSDGRRPFLQRVKKKRLTPNEMFVIPAGQFAFLETLEEITVPSDAMAFISLKSHVKWDGIINVSGFHVDPGYQGKLIFSVYNAGPSPVMLEQSMPLFLIWFAALDVADSKEVRPPGSGKSISRELIKRMSPEILSLQSLSKEISKLRTSMRIQAIVFGFGALALLAIVSNLTGSVLQYAMKAIFVPGAQTHIGASTPRPAGKGEPTGGAATNHGTEASPAQMQGNTVSGTLPAKPTQPPATGAPNPADK